MDWRNRIGLYGSYFLATAGIGFTLPFLPVYLQQEGLSPAAIGLISTLAALSSLVQFPLGLWSDRLGRRKPFLLAALALLTLATGLLHGAHGAVWLGLLVILFAENGICRATIESLSGAAATCLAPLAEVGAALGALRFWKPISIVLVAFVGGLIAERAGVGAILLPLFALQVLSLGTVLLLHETPTAARCAQQPKGEAAPRGRGLRDATLWAFFGAMVLFHVGNAPAGVYLGLFMKDVLHAKPQYLSYAFVVSMVAWMLVVRPLGRWADRLGRRPLLIAAWAVMAVRLGLLTMAGSPEQILAIQVLDGVANAGFAVLAAAWMTDRLGDPRRAGEAQVLVGTALVLGSALGPGLASLLVEGMDYREVFGLLAGVGVAATALIILFIPETVRTAAPAAAAQAMPTTSGLSTTP